MLMVTGTAMVVFSMCVSYDARGVGASLGSCRVELELEELRGQSLRELRCGGAQPRRI